MKLFIEPFARVARTAAITGLATVLAACGGSGGGNAASYTLGGSVSGLNGSVELGTNAGDRITIDSNRSFTFATKFRRGKTFAVSVIRHPAGQICNVSNGTGTMPAADVTNVSVFCITQQVSGVVGGTIAGLTGTVVLNYSIYGDDQAFDNNGPFAFAEQSAVGNPYDLVVVSQPAGQVCSVGNGFGAVTEVVDDIQVNCVDAATTFEVRGTISGLGAAGLRIENGAGNAVEPAAGAMAFALPVRLGNTAAYDVGIAAQPVGQTCVVVHSTGTVNAADVTDIEVQCLDNDTDPLSGTYTVPGLQPGSYVYMTLFPDGVYVYGSIEDNPPCDAVNAGNGVEYGVYFYNAVTHSFSIMSAAVDTNGDCGVWDSNGSRFNGATLTVAGSGASTVLTLTPSGGGAPFELVPVASVAGEITGSWASPYEKSALVFLPNGSGQFYYLSAETQDDLPPLETGIEPGIEYACASVSSMTGGLLAPDLWECAAPTPSDAGTRDTNGRAGLSRASGGTWPFTVSGDTMTLLGRTYTRVTPP